MKKKMIASVLFMAVCAILIGACVTSGAGASKSFKLNPLADEDYQIRQNPDNTVTITGIKGVKNIKQRNDSYQNRDAVIPAEIFGLPVKISSDAFNEYGPILLRSVVIPDTITELADGMFEGCGLKQVTLGKGLKRIPNRAFCDNPDLTKIIIPDTITAIGASAFQGCGFTSIIIPDSITSIGNHAFSRLSKRGGTSVGGKLTSVTLPKGLTNLSGFSDNQLTSITIPDSVTSIGVSAFSGNRLTSIIIPDGVTSIGAYAFSHNQLTSITIPSSVTSIGVSAFSTNRLTSVTLPTGLKTIGAMAFIANQIVSVTIPDGIESIGSNPGGNKGLVFYNNNVVSITLPANLDNDVLKSYAFEDNIINYYNGQGKVAGTYTKNGSVWTRQ